MGGIFLLVRKMLDREQGSCTVCYNQDVPRVQICQKSRRIGCVIMCCKLPWGSRKQPILQLLVNFSKTHICQGDEGEGNNTRLQNPELPWERRQWPFRPIFVFSQTSFRPFLPSSLLSPRSLLDFYGGAVCSAKGKSQCLPKPDSSLGSLSLPPSLPSFLSWAV